MDVAAVQVVEGDKSGAKTSPEMLGAKERLLDLRVEREAALVGGAASSRRLDSGGDTSGVGGAGRLSGG